jgi:hypothetical protein
VIHAYCRGQLKIARQEAKSCGVKIPSFGGSKLVGYEQYGIFFDDWYIEQDGCCAMEARAKAVIEYIKKHK